MCGLCEWARLFLNDEVMYRGMLMINVNVSVSQNTPVYNGVAAAGVGMIFPINVHDTEIHMCFYSSQRELEFCIIKGTESRINIPYTPPPLRKLQMD